MIVYKRNPMKKNLHLYLVAILMIIISACNNSGTKEATTDNSESTKEVAESTAATKTILFFGNSLTAGYGLEPSQSFPALIQHKIDSLKLPYKVVNAGVSGETSSGGNGRIDWILKQPIDVFVLELGANDGLRGVPVAETRKNLQAIIDKVKAKYPAVKLVLAGMQVPPNMGQKYAGDFRDLYPALAKENHMILIPFLLQGVGGEVKLNQQDGIHPTAEGTIIVANNIWKQLEKVL
jgi:acyl-CoA thioesterase-1